MNVNGRLVQPKFSFPGGLLIFIIGTFEQIHITNQHRMPLVYVASRSKLVEIPTISLLLVLDTL